MGKVHTGLRLSLSGADSESYFDPNVLPLGYQKERATAGNLAQ